MPAPTHLPHSRYARICYVWNSEVDLLFKGMLLLWSVTSKEGAVFCSTLCVKYPSE